MRAEISIISIIICLSLNPGLGRVSGGSAESCICIDDLG